MRRPRTGRPRLVARAAATRLCQALPGRRSQQIAATVSGRGGCWDRSGASPKAHAARLEREHDNLRAALAWAEECGESETLARLAGAPLYGFCFLQGFMAEGSRWAEAALARSAGLPPSPLRAQVVGMTADFLAWGRGDHDAALDCTESAPAQFRRSATPGPTAICLSAWGWSSP